MWISIFSRIISIFDPFSKSRLSNPSLMDLIGFNGYLFCSSILPALVASLLSQKLSSSNVGVLLHSIVHDLPIILEPLLIISLSVYARLFISTPNPSCFCCFKKPLLFPFFFFSVYSMGEGWGYWEKGSDLFTDSY